MATVPRTPEQRRAYRARCIAENRCANCAAPREASDTQTLLCAKCRQRKRTGSNKTYADKRAQTPPDFSRAPDKPFRYGKTRLNAPRRVTVTLDEETYFWIKTCRQHYCRSDAYEPYQVSEVIRRLLSLLPHAPADISTGWPNRLPCGEACGLHLCFMCDAENFARITAHHQNAGRTFAQAVRDCIQHAAKYATSLPNEEAKRLLWPGYDDLPQSEITPADCCLDKKN